VFVQFQEGSSYADWLHAMGVHSTFVVHKIRQEVPPSGWNLRWARKRISERLLSGISSPEARGMFAAMILGEREALPPDVKEVFIKSATVHIFSISGLHVGLLFGCITLLLRVFCVQSRLRLQIVLPVVGAYVLLCGAMPSAVRAYFMLVVLSFTDLQYRERAPENALAVAGIVLLCINPLYLRHTGFVFSFVLVASLLRSRKLARHWTELLTEKQYWLPYAKRRLWRLKAAGYSTVFGGIAAWLGCSGIMMHFNGMISFGSLLINLAMLPVASLLAAGALLKLLWNAPFLAVLLEKLLSFMMLLSRIGSLSSLHVEGAPLSLGVTLLYYAALLVVFSALPVKLRCASLALMVGIVVCFCLRHPTNIHIQASSSDGRPSACAYVDSASCAHILQPGGHSALSTLISAMGQLGVREVDSIYVPARSDAFALERAIEKMPPRRIVFSMEAMRSARLKGLFGRLAATGINVSIGPPPEEIPAPAEPPPPPSLPPQIRISHPQEGDSPGGT